MSPQLISIYALVAMFVVATILPVNMGVLAFVGAFLVGTSRSRARPRRTSSPAFPVVCS